MQIKGPPIGGLQSPGRGSQRPAPCTPPLRPTFKRLGSESEQRLRLPAAVRPGTYGASCADEAPRYRDGTRGSEPLPPIALDGRGGRAEYELGPAVDSSRSRPSSWRSISSASGVGAGRDPQSHS